jgi:zinc/manganese transport system ATP-binding protein
MNDEPVVALDRASAVVGGRTVWSDVTLQVAAGEFIAVLGPNGVGKSTLLKSMLGLVPVQHGSATILGRPAGSRTDLVGYVPQRRTFPPSLRVRGVDVVRMGLDGDKWGFAWPAALGGRSDRIAKERVDEVIVLVGASAYAHRPIGECSGGEQQRLLIAQALVRKPRVLLLDEPLDSLDVTNQASVSSLLRDVCHRDGVAVVLVAHDVNPIVSYLDKVIYLSRGGALVGTPAEVITAETLTRLYNTPIDVLHDRTGRLVVVGQPDVHTHHHP